MAEERRDERLKVSASVAMQLIAWIVGLMLVYAATNARIAVLESKYDAMHDDIVTIKSDVRALLQRP